MNFTSAFIFFAPRHTADLLLDVQALEQSLAEIILSVNSSRRLRAGHS